MLYAGRLLPVKGPDVLVDAAGRVPTARLLIVGDGPLRSSLESRAPTAVFAGFLDRDDLVRAYVAADVFALISRRETWGVVVVEAAACGLPLVLSDAVGAAATCLSGANGELVPSGDAIATAAAIGARRTSRASRRLRRRSHEVAARWSFGPSEDAFAAAFAPRSRSRLSRMPVDPSHAFAGGRVFPEPTGPARLRRHRRTAAWRSFRRGALLGANCRLGPNAWCSNDGDADRITLGNGVVCRGVVRRESFGDGRIGIGDDVYMGDDCILSAASGITIGSGTLLGHGVQVFDNNSHPTDAEARAADWRAVRSGGRRGEIASAPILIGDRAWIGFGAVILKGVTIGDDAVVAAASVVTSDVPAGVTVAGNPAHPVD